MKKIENPQTVECPQLSHERQLLWDAANYMERYGKTTKREPIGENASGQVCVIVAMKRCRPDDLDLRIQAQHMLEDFLGERWVSTWSDVNDQQTVVAALRSAALS